MPIGFNAEEQPLPKLASQVDAASPVVPIVDPRIDCISAPAEHRPFADVLLRPDRQQRGNQARSRQANRPAAMAPQGSEVGAFPTLEEKKGLAGSPDKKFSTLATSRSKILGLIDREDGGRTEFCRPTLSQLPQKGGTTIHEVVQG